MKRTLVRSAVVLALALSLAGCGHGGHGGGVNTAHSGGGHSSGGWFGHSGGGHSSGSGHSSGGGHSGGYASTGGSHADQHPHGTPDWGRLGNHGTAMGSGPQGEPDPAYYAEFSCAAKREEWMAVHHYSRVPPQLQCAPDGAFGAPVVYGPQRLAGAGGDPDE